MVWRWVVDATGAPTTLGYCGLSGSTPPSTTVTPAPPPPVWTRADVTVTGSGTTIIIPGVTGQTIKVVRYLLDAAGSGNASFDVQDTNGQTLTGGPVSVNPGTPVAFNYGSTEEILRNPIFQTQPGDGLQFVTTGNTTINGFIDYLQQ
jgi:hypothetical protein